MVHTYRLSGSNDAKVLCASGMGGYASGHLDVATIEPECLVVAHGNHRPKPCILQRRRMKFYVASHTVPTAAWLLHTAQYQLHLVFKRNAIYCLSTAHANRRPQSFVSAIQHSNHSTPSEPQQPGCNACIDYAVSSLVMERLHSHCRCQLATMVLRNKHSLSPAANTTDMKAHTHQPATSSFY